MINIFCYIHVILRGVGRRGVGRHCGVRDGMGNSAVAGGETVALDNWRALPQPLLFYLLRVGAAAGGPPLRAPIPFRKSSR